MKYLIAMDSFKGCLDAKKVCAAASRGIMQIPENETVCLPLADGGEGTASAVCRALGGQIISCSVTDPFGNPAEGSYGVVPHERLAVIDTASASGLGLARAGQGNILSASTYGTGLQIKDMLEQGYSRIVVGLGGSGTNDGGVGALYALGAAFYNKDGNIIPNPCAKDLPEIFTVDISGLDRRLTDADLTLMFDVDIPLYGGRGSTLNYSPQKGADPDMVRLLEAGMISYAEAVKRSLGIDASSLSGAGAAGGLGFGLFIAGGKLVNGAVHMLELCGFDRLCADADIVITGEGRTDFQTAHGKLPAAVASAAKRHRLPVVCVCGAAKPSESLYKIGIDGIFAIPNCPMTIENSIENAELLISETCRNIAGFAASLVK